MTDDDIRYVLSAYAATAPDLDPRAGLAERVARRERARRAAVAGVACLAAAIAGAGVAAVTRDRGATGLVVAADPTPTETPYATEDPAPSPSATAEPSPSPAEVSPTATATATATASESARPVVTEPPPTGPTSDSDRGEEGLRVEAELSPGSVATATYASLRVVATDDDGQPQVTKLTWGDGSGEILMMVASSCEWRTPVPTARPKAPGDLDQRFSHAWRHPGTYTVTAEVSSDTGCAEPPGKVERTTVTVRVVVTEGEVLSNGPEKPAFDGSAHPTDESGEDRSEWRVLGTLTDRDGYFASATVDWGDGSPTTTVENPQPCDDGEGRHYPRYGSLGLDEATHTYAVPGTYTIRVTYQSAGCDGKDAQPSWATLRADAS